MMGVSREIAYWSCYCGQLLMFNGTQTEPLCFVFGEFVMPMLSTDKRNVLEMSVKGATSLLGAETLNSINSKLSEKHASGH